MIEQVKHFFSVPPPEGLRTELERILGTERRYYFLRWEWDSVDRRFTILLPQVGMEIYLRWPPTINFAGSWMHFDEDEDEEEL